MKTKLIPTLLILCFSLLLSACNKSATNNLTQTENKVDTKSENFSQKSTLKNLLGMGKNLTCTYSFIEEESKYKINGITYISGKKFASEVETVDSSDIKKNVKSLMYSDGDYVYIWSPDKKGYGMKVKIENSIGNSNEVKTDVASAQESMNKEYDMKCSPWTVDQSKLTLPSDVKFSDLSEMMKQVPLMPSIPALPK